jgi:hypothetical protein
MRRLLISLVCLLSACAPELTPMSKDEAENVLERFARGRAPTSPCTDEGRMLLRSAAHSYAEALYEEGRVWPDVESLMEADVDRDFNVSNLDAFVLGAVISGFIKPQDLRGPGRSMTAFIHMAATHSPASPATPGQMQYACEEVFALHQASARYVLSSQRHRRSMDLAERRHDYRRIREIRQLYGRSDERAQREIMRLSEALQRKLASAPQRPEL